MDRLVVRGGIPLRGTVRAAGAKNAALPLLAATLLVDGPSRLSRVPALKDVETMLALLRAVGARVWREGDRVAVAAGGPLLPDTPDELVASMRASFLVVGPLLARIGRVRATLPGGCAIGARPVDLHLRGLEALGARITLDRGWVQLEAKRLRGTTVYLDVPSVTTTENLMMAACLADGITVIENAAREPEVTDLARFLGRMGAEIEGIGTGRLIIHGGRPLQPVEYAVMPDRIETGTFLMAAAATGGAVTVVDTEPSHLAAVILKLREAGCEVQEGPNWVRCIGVPRLRPVTVRTLPYPGFPTDLQAPMVAVLTRASGTSIVIETIFENRFLYVPELGRMGARIMVEERTAVVHGVPQLRGSHLHATDLRAGAALIIAALSAEGDSEITGMHHVDRGYEDFAGKLQALGAAVTRLDSARPLLRTTPF